MSIFGWVSLASLIWTISGFIWFAMCLGRKYRKNRWYDYPLSVPVFAIAYILQGIYWVIGIFKKEKNREQLCSNSSQDR